MLKGYEPFFPLGFVFGKNDQDMLQAKSVGMNSLHQEYSIADVFPHSGDKISEKGLNKIKGLHQLAAKHEMTLSLFSRVIIFRPGWEKNWKSSGRC